MNLIPKTGPVTGNYFCTWSYQMYAAHVTGEQIADGSVGVRQRDALTEETLFDEPGVLTKAFTGCRGDLIVVLDDGWDVGWNMDKDKYPELTGEFASCEIFPERFPSLHGDPAERLFQLSERVKKLGYRGLGLWIACQVRHQAHDKPVDLETAEAYWTERAKWCHRAGILYWKVDWGYEGYNHEFRKMMTRVAHTYAPGLIVENAYGMLPFNNLLGEPKRFCAWDGGHWLRNNLIELDNSDILRAYDTCGLTCILDRTASLLTGSQDGPGRSVINVEYLMYLGAALGCSCGVMNNPLDPTTMLDCVERAVKWQRVAPPFGARENEVFVSDEIITSAHMFGMELAWTGIMNEAVRQSAPAVVSRGMPLPAVNAEGEKPFIVAAKHPQTGAVSVGALPRCSAEKGEYTPRADVTIDAMGADTFGVFGHFGSLRIENAKPGAKVWMQDLMADIAVDVTDMTLHGGEIVVPGSLTDQIGLSCAHAGDASEPGAIVKIL